MGNQLIEISGEKRAETGNAFLIFDGARSAWVPKSQVTENDDGTFTMPEWLAQAKEFI